MISSKLIKPESIVVVGGSDNTSKPGGKILENIINGGFRNLIVVNPNSEFVQGIRAFSDIESIPVTDLAILAIPAKNCLSAIKALAAKGVEAYIIISAGFAELDDEGKKMEEEIVNFAGQNSLSILGPNCIGIINEHYKGVFTLPVPDFNPRGVDFISSSGSVAVFTMEAGLKSGMQFSGIYSVGNAAQIKIEDLLEFYDHNYRQGYSPEVLMIYIEQISDPAKFIRHCRSLNGKGCNVVGTKSGITGAGIRAASSHTGAMASTEIVVNSIFRKAGVIQCDSRQEMLTVAGVLFYRKPAGKNIAIITHAGGSGVMTADALEKNGMSVPEISGEMADILLSKLHKGSSVSNPIDFLATGNAEQLAEIIDFCNYEAGNIDEIIVIFGSPGLFDVNPVYDVLSEKIDKSPKPIYPVLPSLVNTEQATLEFTRKNRLFFSDEVVLAKALAKVYNNTPVFEYKGQEIDIPTEKIKNIIKNNRGKFLEPGYIKEILDFAGIMTVPEFMATNTTELGEVLKKIKFPLVFKAIGPLHKSDVGGVILDISTAEEATKAFEQIMRIENVRACLIQPMIKGMELFAGAKKDGQAGHLLMFGTGGIYLEILRDVQSVLLPLEDAEANYLISQLRSYPILKGARGMKGINENEFKNVLIKLSGLLRNIPEISEIDINPLIATKDNILAVDCRIMIEP